MNRPTEPVRDRSPSRRAFGRRGRAIGEKWGEGFIVLSVAARFVQLLQALLRGIATLEPVYVVDEDAAAS